MFDIVVAPLSKSNKHEQAAVDKQQEEVGSTDADKIILDLPPSSLEERTQQLAFLPTKFRKLVWIKRNDFVIVQCGEEESTEQQSSDQKDSSGNGSGGFRYVITNILYKDQVKHIKSKNLWPDDPYFADDPDIGEEKNGDDGIDNKDDDSASNDNEAGYEDDGIVFEDPYLDDEYMINTNRVARLTVDDSSSDEDSE